MELLSQLFRCTVFRDHLYDAGGICMQFSRSTLFTGCATALVTPFLPGGTLDETALRHLIEIQIDAGIDALILLGTTGEPCTLSMQERETIIRIGLETVQGRVPVIVGTGSNNTQQTIEYAIQARQLGAQGQLTVTPYYNKTTQTGLLRHYDAILTACPLPMILYHVPSRTGMSFEASTASALSKNHPIAGFKDASGNLRFTTELIEQTAGTLPIYCGNDDLIASMMALGACGAISVCSNLFPKALTELTHLCQTGYGEKAQAIQDSLLPLLHALSCQVNPIPVKAALSMLDMIHDELRLPLVPLEEPYRQNLLHILNSMSWSSL